MKNTTIDVFINPRIEGGRFRYDVETRFTSNMRESGPCQDNVWAMFCDWFVPNRQNMIKTNVEASITAYLSQSDIRVLLESYLNSFLASGGYTRMQINAAGDLLLFR